MKQGISLSGLLNAIDGVASHEGRVLVMTTNHPEKLDDALIRPGRVDMQVEFSLATRAQAQEIFVRMYTNDREKLSKPRFVTANGYLAKSALPATLRHRTNGSAGKVNGHLNGSINGFMNGSSTPPSPASLNLQHLGKVFAESLPEGKFSPAEIQGFLLTRKKEPEKALAEVKKWRDALLEAKEKKAKVVPVQ